MPNDRTFPIQGIEAYTGNPVRLPWALGELLCAEYIAQHGGTQTIEDLARRGGFGVYEAIKLAADAAIRAQSKTTK